MSMKSGATLRFEPGSLQEAIYDVYIGCVVGAAHYLYFLKKWTLDLIINPVLYMTGIAEKPQTKLHDGRLKVVGIGYGRTGTYSLTLALEELGFPTLHTQHLYENEEIFRMWTDLIFNPSLEKGQAELGHPNFEVITQHGFEATTDFPMALYFDQILEKYPDCKFILTTRENSDVWFRSWDTLTKSITAPTYFGGFFITGVRQYSIYLRWLFALVNKDNSFLTSSSPKINQYREAAIESYETHNTRVRELIPQSQLLEYSVKQGWQPLCDFLEISDCPMTAFPKTNSARSVQVQAISAAITPLIIVLFCIFYMFTRVFQRLTGRTVIGWINLQSTLLTNFFHKTLMDRSEKQMASNFYVKQRKALSKSS